LGGEKVLSYGQRGAENTGHGFYSSYHAEGKAGAAAILGLNPIILKAWMHKLGILRPEIKEPD